jgi:hypothetical protein
LDKAIKIKRARRLIAAGWSQAGVAIRLGVRKSAIRDWTHPEKYVNRMFLKGQSIESIAEVVALPVEAVKALLVSSQEPL